MKPLRVVQSREGQQDVENDLRGLGDEPILNNNDPSVALIAEGEKAFVEQAFRQCARHANLLVTKLSDHRLHIAHHPTLPFKEQIVDLFVQGLALTATLPASSPLTFGLIINDTFKQKMSAATNGSLHTGLDEQKINDFMQADTFFKISRTAIATLSQAGFNIARQNSDLCLNRSSIEQHVPKKITNPVKAKKEA